MTAKPPVVIVRAAHVLVANNAIAVVPSVVWEVVATFEETPGNADAFAFDVACDAMTAKMLRTIMPHVIPSVTLLIFYRAGLSLLVITSLFMNCASAPNAASTKRLASS